jgi:hypothetical protein
MGMPCQVNSILKLSPAQGYPDTIVLNTQHQIIKQGYRIIPIDVPIPLVDQHWSAHADIIIHRLTWEKGKTAITFEIHRIYAAPFPVKP